VTLAAVRRLDKDLLLEALLWERLTYYRAITSDESNALIKLAAAVRRGDWQTARRLVDKAEGLKFLRWWINRLVNLRLEVGCDARIPD